MSAYSLVLSYSEANQAYADAVITAALDAGGANIAVVYRTKRSRDALGSPVFEGRDGGVQNTLCGTSENFPAKASTGTIPICASP